METVTLACILQSMSVAEVRLESMLPDFVLQFNDQTNDPLHMCLKKDLMQLDFQSNLEAKEFIM